MIDELDALHMIYHWTRDGILVILPDSGATSWRWKRFLVYRSSTTDGRRHFGLLDDFLGWHFDVHFQNGVGSGGSIYGNGILAFRGGVVCGPMAWIAVWP
jgi:hypothetical protein